MTNLDSIEAESKTLVCAGPRDRSSDPTRD